MIALALAPAAAVAVPVLPVGTDRHGVTVPAGRQGRQMTFAPAAAKRFALIAGKRVELGCGSVTLNGSAPVTSSEGFETVRAPRRRAPLTIGFVGNDDFCFVRLPRPHTNATREIAIVPITPNGALYLDARATARDVLGILLIAEATGQQRYFPTPAALATVIPVNLPLLAGPGADPPASGPGYWSDGLHHVYVTERSQAGHVAFFEQDGEVSRTNLLPFLNDYQTG